MARIRSIKPGFWTSQTLAKVTRDARLVFIGLFNEADDEGRLADSAKRLAGALFPFDDSVDAPWMEQRLVELARVGAIVRYSHEGARFIAIPGFREHQVINRPRPSTMPPPPTLTESSVKAHGVLTESSVEDWNGLEEEGKGVEASAAAPATPAPPVNRGRQNPDAPPPLAGVLISKAKPGRQGGWQAGKPYTVDELMRQPEGQRLRENAPALDGRGGRPRIEAVIEMVWDSFARWNWPTQAMAKLEVIVAEHNAKHRRDWAKDGGVDVAAISTKSPKGTGPPLAEGETELPAWVQR